MDGACRLDLKKYYTCQTNICLQSELYGDNICEHGDKVIMLFAEVFPFLVQYYDIEKTSNMVLNFENSAFFKKWFWKVKHELGENLNRDPLFFDIGKWIGRGLFIKIILSVIYYNKLLLEKKIAKKITDKQKLFIDELASDDFFKENKKAIEKSESSYILLGENVISDINHENFFISNIIN